MRSAILKWNTYSISRNDMKKIEFRRHVYEVATWQKFNQVIVL